MNTTILSNSAVAFDATDKLIADHAGNFAGGELARLKFLEDVAKAYVAKELRHAPIKGKRTAHEGDHAEYAITLWNAKRAAKLEAKTGKHVPVRAVDGSRKSELKTILRATVLNPTIVTDAWKASDTIEGDKKPRTYECIVKAAQAQTADDVMSAKRKLGSDELKSAMLPKESETDETKSLDAIVKKLGKMAEQFPANAKSYLAAAKALAPIVSLLKGDAARAKFIEDAVSEGYTVEQASTFYDMRFKKAA
jgi:hypothetical protein